LKFEKRSQFFVGGDDESLSIVAVCISNEDRLSVGINRCDAAPTPTGFAEIVSDDFPELHVDRIVPLLVSTQQSQNDMKGRNDAGDNLRHCRDCASLHCGNTAARNFSSRLKWLWKPFEIMGTATEWLKNASALPD
jgi:hypothetical protein